MSFRKGERKIKQDIYISFLAWYNYVPSAPQLPFYFLQGLLAVVLPSQFNAEAIKTGL